MFWLFHQRTELLIPENSLKDKTEIYSSIRVTRGTRFSHDVAPVHKSYIPGLFFLSILLIHSKKSSDNKLNITNETAVIDVFKVDPHFIRPDNLIKILQWIMLP